MISYFTDGLRAVFFLADEPVAPSAVVILDSGTAAGDGI